MWIFTNKAFVSIVEDRENPELLLVRARIDGDIQRIFGPVPVFDTPAADYRYRTRLPRPTVAAEIAVALTKVDYPNFKGSVRENDRHDAYMAVWQEMLHFQNLRAFAEKRKESAVADISARRARRRRRFVDDLDVIGSNE